ncbi:MAG: glycoside hydrolase family 3 protein [Prevotella sp.]|nr:glycoside hydrolase family 3 protein [Alistipes senegalensis]MCM1357742.1 glycoside hydrolase family 3 protein [Prevotella sp.]MCM1474073.1 glycoside hydrolase family 3 protein [Muribaculaceae bacterium]
MKNFKKKLSTVMLTAMMLTGCGQVVQNMQDTPVINPNQPETQAENIPDNSESQTLTSKGYIAGNVVTETTIESSAVKSGTVAATEYIARIVTETSTTTTVTVYVPRNNGIQYGTTHVVPVNPDLDTSGLTKRTTAPESTTTTATTTDIKNTTTTTKATTANNVTTSPEITKMKTTSATTSSIPATNTTTTTTTTTTTSATTTTTTTTSKPDNPQELLEQMSLEEKVYQMFMVKPEQITGIYPTTASGETTKNAIAEYPVGGIIYFADNLVSVPQTQSMLENVQQYAKDSSGVGIFTAIDEEGGTVARAAQKLGTTSFWNMQYYGDRNDTDEGYSIGYTIGSDLKHLGFNVDFAPVADVNINENNELGNRIFSSDPSIVANMATAVANGLQDAGVSATLKHFPGLGAEDGNTHNDSFVVIDRTVDELRESEFVPFRAGIENGVDFIMVSHQIVTGFGDDLPADLSYTAVTEYLREELGFDGIAITDAQQMNTISTVYSSGDAAVMSIQAGIDIILMPENLQEAVDSVCDAVENGSISEERIDESVSRILNKKYELGLF